MLLTIASGKPEDDPGEDQAEVRSSLAAKAANHISSGTVERDKKVKIYFRFRPDDRYDSMVGQDFSLRAVNVSIRLR
jgi:hypothetical protein